MPPRLAIVATLALLPSLLAAQQKGGALAGTVRDTLGNPLRLVEVSVEKTNLTAVTDDSGRFHITGIAEGKNGFSLRRVGFSPVEFETTLEAGRTLVVDIRMKSLQTLDAVSVVAAGPVGLHRAGFYERQRMGIGSFVTPEKLDSLSNLPSASMMAMSARTRGIRRMCDRRAGNSCDLQFRSEYMCRWLFIDGKQVEGSFDELVSPANLAAIEVYDRISVVPAEFQGRMPESRNTVSKLVPLSGCGAIVVWTKGYTAR